MVAVWLVFQVRSWAWWRGDLGQEGFDDVPESWWEWGSAADLLLFGPDAGNWAANARALMEGTEPDLNRLPVYGWLTGGMSLIFEDYAFAGHLVNHLASALVCVLTYFLGRAMGGRGVGLGAALLVAMLPPLINAQNLYGVDPVMNLMVLLLILAGWWAMTGPWWAVIVAGVVGGLCASTHYLSLAFPLPVALLLTLYVGDGGRRDWARRLAAPVALLCISWLVFQAMMLPYPPLSLKQAMSVYAEGVVGSHDRGDLSGEGLGAALSLVSSKLDGAQHTAVQTALSPLLAGLPWWPLLAAFWVGLVGPLLGRDPRMKWGWDWRAALWLGLLMAPVILLEGARAPDRYRYYSAPLVMIVVMRGVASLCALADLGGRRLHERWPRGLLAVLACTVLAASLFGPLREDWPANPPLEEGMHERAVGLAVATHFGSGGGVVTLNQSIPFYSGRDRCPQAQWPAEGEVRRSRQLIRSQCAGSGDLPYILDEREIEGYADRRNVALDAWVSENFSYVEAVSSEGRRTYVYRVPRSAL